MEVSEMSSASSGCEDSGDKNPPANSEKTETDWRNFFSWIFEGRDFYHHEPAAATSNSSMVDEEEEVESLDETSTCMFQDLKKKLEEEKTQFAKLPGEGDKDIFVWRVKKYILADEILNSLSEDQKNDSCCDIVFEVEGVKFPAHKGVLKAKSSYFAAMFSGHFDETSKKVINLQDVTSDAFSVVIDFAYGRRAKMTLNNINNVYTCADMFFLDNLGEECKIQIKSLWQPDKICALEPKHCANNISMLCDLVDRMRLIEFKEHLLKTARESIVKSKTSKEILLELDGNTFLDLLRVDTELNTARQVNLMEFTIEWILRKPSERLTWSPRIFTTLNLKYVPKDVYVDFERRMVELCDTHGSGQDTIEIVSSLTQHHQKCDNVEKSGGDFVICSFNQNPVTLVGDVRVYRAGNSEWRVMKFDLKALIHQSVRVGDSLILLSVCGYHAIDLLDFSTYYKESLGLLRFTHGFVACAQNEQLIIAGKSSFKRGTKEVIVVCDFHFYKAKPSLVQLFYFKATDKDVAGVYANEDSIFVLTTSPGVPKSAVLCVKHNEFISYYSIDSFRIDRKIFACRIFFEYVGNEHMFLIDSFDQGVVFSGVVVHLLNHPAECDVWDRVSNFDFDSDVDWLDTAMGTFLGSCYSSTTGHLILVAQDKSLLLFSLKNRTELEFSLALPGFASDQNHLDFDTTNFFISYANV